MRIVHKVLFGRKAVGRDTCVAAVGWATGCTWQ